MTPTRVDITKACDRVLADIAADPRYAHTSQLHVRINGRVLVDEHLQGPVTAPVFSITKSLVATTLAAMDAQNLLPDLRSPLAAVLPQLSSSPAATHTWHHVLTMTRGAQVEGPWEADQVALLPRDQVRHVAAAPHVAEPGSTFRYDNAGVHLLSAAAAAVLDEPLAHFAERTVFEPIGAQLGAWPSDPDGITWGSEGVEMTAADLSLVGQLWLDRGHLGDRRIMSRRFFDAMMTPHSPGGSPESCPYGYLVWLPTDQYMAGGWAGQHMVVAPRSNAVVTTFGNPNFDLGPPPHDDLPPDWRPALDLIRRHLLPVLP